MTEHLTNTIRAAQKGDESAFRVLIEEHYGYVYRIAYKILLNSDDARDAAQESCIKLWRNIGVFRLDMNFTTWLYRIVSNTSLDILRRRSRHEDIDSTTAPSQVGLATPLLAAEESDMVTIVHALLRRLPPVQRLVFALRDVEDLAIDEVVSITGLSTASVKTNLSYARSTIRTLLQTEYNIKRSEQ